ncbi:MAG: nucleoside triphosphate pyrophosphohydrolase [Deltaproteobacteria bacterium]|nr:nucleoside triphosphate pyrophosphohydrolase [Deltaproteobacteria bacterium]
MKPNAKGAVSFDDLRQLLIRLRSPGGCPWDRQQTPESLKTYLLEETYELAEALDRQSPAEIQEELGDLLFILLFISRVYEERGAFDLDRVLTTIHQKMVRRHPHVFGEADWKKAEEVVKGWQTIKAEENPEKNPFDSIPAALPSLLKAHRLSQRAAGLGFEWPDLAAVVKKAHEEMAELEEALRESDPEAAREELGDLLFVLVNLGRLLGTTAENILRQTNLKFQKRFLRLLADPDFQGAGTAARTAEEWTARWNRTKTDPD